MTKEEFLNILRGRITGSIPTSEVESQIDYYSAYLDGRIAAGLSEEDAVAELGDPRLIAKTVIESTDRAAEAAGYDGLYRSSTDTYDDSDGINSGIFGTSPPRDDTKQQGSNHKNPYQQGAYHQADQQPNQDMNAKVRRVGTIGCIIAVVIFILILALFWALITFVFRLGFGLFGWLLPIAAGVAIVALIVKLVRKK